MDLPHSITPEILQSLEDFVSSFSPKPLSATERLSRAKEHFVHREFARKLYLELHKTISTATASRDLKQATEAGILSRSGEKSLTLYRFR